MAGGTESNGTGIGEFPSLVLGTAKWHRNFFRFAGTWKSGSARLLGSLTCALPVLPSVVPTTCWTSAGGSGAMKRSSISCRNNL